LNPNTIAYVTIIDDVRLELEENMLGMGTSIEKSFQALVIGKLFLFKKLSIFLSTCASPLTWWCMHGGKFSNVGFLAK
jgi:hypothetical protein